ncbi:hypothetical protein [Mycobacteroides abscessus]|uniref:hypothetical protein n=1 Tax=Mycobacteroides abscessus TaxID=36809 RepID=UPI00092ACBEF|nr:hypothetical protein [Mycobacteroides abscessus]MDM2174688.1 hypothetical protein [Mycobacteroides abscessus]MDM2179565.1 hypothetical protein [Mycobacteroides abscessus]MDM2209625.1 hypothetical protein [Mycobacteroides abscessus]MDM2214604.1 hypothetical protein [Mycobacteroides abscessus]MDM2219598.1 hypothetical protein [Mycobacteroides abscessus]
MSTQEISQPNITESEPSLADAVHYALNGHLSHDYVCQYRRKQFHALGKPCFLNRYEAQLSRYGKVLQRWSFRRRTSAENQCIRWVRMYGSVVLNRAP